jgi:uncharacterized membrane protein YgdD (TMEM256/DUF423 family)
VVRCGIRQLADETQYLICEVLVPFRTTQETMLLIVLIILFAGTIYAVAIAPPDQRVLVGAVVVGLAAAGYGVGYVITQPGSDERTYYSIATAIGGVMIAFGWISRKQKSWPKKPKQP